jgi:hypothetical protein
MATVITVVLLAPGPAAGQASTTAADTWTVGRTPDGQPDLQGIWVNNNATPLERPAALAGKEFLTDDEVAAMKERAALLFANDAGDAAFGEEVFEAVVAEAPDFSSSDTETGNYNQFWVVERDFDNRTSLVVDPPDGRLPALTPEAEERADALKVIRERIPEGPEDKPLGTRCITFSVPSLIAGYNSYYHLLQTPGYVVILMEMIHDVRIIPLDGRPHIGEDIRQWHGDSRGRWEGDTLVIETTNYSPKSDFKGSSENLHVIERFTRVGPNRINYEFTIEDPTTWTSDWTAMIPLKKSEDAIFEYACHEGNYGMPNLLAGARAQEKAAAEAR